MGDHKVEEGNSPSTIPSLAIGTPRQRNHAVVLRKRRHGRDCAQRSKHAVDSIRQDTALDPAFVQFPIDFQPGYITGSCDITNGFACANDEDCEDGQDEGPVDGKGEGMDPDKRGDRRGGDAGFVKVAAGGGDDAAHQKADDDGAGFHDGGAEALAEDDCDEDGEAEACWGSIVSQRDMAVRAGTRHDEF